MHTEVDVPWDPPSLVRQMYFAHVGQCVQVKNTSGVNRLFLGYLPECLKSKSDCQIIAII